MSNDLIANGSRPVDLAPVTAGGPRHRPRPSGTHGDARSRARLADPYPAAAIEQLRPFADADEARSVAGSCRAMLARHIEPPDLVDSIAVVLAAKVMDETVGGIGFEAIEGQPRVSASRFDRVVRAVLELLREAPGDIPWPDVDVPELVAHQVLHDLGPYSMLQTAEQPGGATTLRALFVAAVGDDHGAVGPSVLADPAVAASLWRLVPASTASPSLGTLASAASEVFLVGDDHIVDLRDADPITGPEPA
jgi:hypothetical protein